MIESSAEWLKFCLICCSSSAQITKILTILAAGKIFWGMGSKYIELMVFTQQYHNKTARIRAKPWMFRLPFKVYGAEITLKNSIK